MTQNLKVFEEKQGWHWGDVIFCFLLLFKHCLQKRTNAKIEKYTNQYKQSNLYKEIFMNINNRKKRVNIKEKGKVINRKNSILNGFLISVLH